MCEHQARVNNSTKFEMNKHVTRLTRYMDRFKNHVGTILQEPETTIDMPFKSELETRERASH